MSLGNLVLAALDLPGGERSSCEKILEQQAGNAWLTVPVKRKDCSFWLFNDAVNFPFGLASQRRPPQVIKNLGKMGGKRCILETCWDFSVNQPSGKLPHDARAVDARKFCF